ncbi:MAG: Cna B-type domain-containing protein, partial [Firmicutes bacterium]|nr:Cna B-type domain-containing protein [Bacillota bacterium]
MKLNKRSLLSLLLTMVLVLGTVSSAFAAGTLTFLGQSQGFDFDSKGQYTESDLFGGLKTVLPGDEITDVITFKNMANDCDYVDLYMKAEMLVEGDEQMLKKDQTPVEEQKAFLAKLHLTVENDGVVIYDGTPNLVDATTGLEEFVLLAKHIKVGETKTLNAILKVPEDLDNEDAGKLGTVKWVFHVDAFNEDQFTVRKVWSDGSAKHEKDSVTVHLIQEITDTKSGAVSEKTYDTQVLNADCNWAYTWSELPRTGSFGSKTYSYHVTEDAVAGYTARITDSANGQTITNQKNTPIVPPGGTVDLRVDKEWELAAGQQMPESVKVGLYKDGELSRTVTLSDDNNWSYLFENLSDRYSWSVGEIDVPEGFTSYITKSRGVTTITNVADSKPPQGALVSRSVTKVWDDNNDELGLRPASVGVVLMKDGEAYETVELSASNNWS